ncbi:hypothetical protein ACQVA2_13695 [Citrobacter sp. OP27]
MQRVLTCGGVRIAERVVKQLRRRPLLNSELAALLGVDELFLYKASRNFVKKRKSYEITAGEIFVNPLGNKDRLYHLTMFNPEEGRGSKNIKNCLHLTGVNYEEEKERRMIRLRMAKERSKLINAGKYCQQEEEKLCKKFGEK